MTTPDTCCTIVPYFKVHEGQLAAFKKGCEEFVEKTSSEPNCLFYGSERVTKMQNLCFSTWITWVHY